MHNDWDKVVALIDYDDSQVLVLEPGDTKDFGVPTKRAHFYFAVEDSANHFVTSDEVTQIACSETHLIDITIQELADRAFSETNKVLMEIKPFAPERVHESMNMDMGDMDHEQMKH